MTTAPVSARGRTKWVGHGLSNATIYRGIASGCARLPLPLLYLISAVGNGIALALMRRTLEGVSANYRNAFGWDGQTARRCSRRLFHEYGRTTVDLFRVRVGGPERIPPLVDHEHDDRVLARALPADGRGSLLVTGHLGNWELGAIYLAVRGFRVAVVGQPELDPGIQALRDQIRGRFGIEWIDIGTRMTTALRVREAIERGLVVAVLADRSYPEDRIEVDYFGRSTPFLRTPALLARFCCCPVLPCYLLRQPDGSYRSHFGAPLHATAGDAHEDEARIMARIAAVLERGVREAPHQWYNFFDYWRTTPLAEASSARTPQLAQQVPDLRHHEALEGQGHRLR